MRYFSFLCGLFAFSLIWAEGDVPANQLLEVAKKATTALTGKIFLTDESSQPSVAIYDLVTNERALVWTADLDIDCDGEEDDKCNKTTDPWFYPSTSAGSGIYASKTPFYVLPVSFPNKNYGVDIGSVGVVIYKDKVVYGPLLDKCGVDNVIGEASYAMAEGLGVNPDPQVGGTSGPVAYIAFSGTAAKLAKADYSNHAKALTIGTTRAKELLAFFNMTDINGDSPHNAVTSFCTINRHNVNIIAGGKHTVTIMNYKGQRIMRMQGVGAKAYSLDNIQSGLYIIRVAGPAGMVTQRVVKY